MRQTRYIAVRDTQAVRDKVEEVGGFGWATPPLDGWVLVRVYNPRLLELAKQFPSDAKVLPPENRTMRRVPQAVKEWLTARGVTFEPGDTVADVIAQLTGSEDFE